MNPLAQMIFSPIFGYMHNKIGSFRTVCLAASTLFIMGNLLYSILSVFPSANGRYYALLASRFLTGASSGEISYSLFRCSIPYVDRMSKLPTNLFAPNSFLHQYHLIHPILGNIAAFRNYTAKATFTSERTKYISRAAAFQTLGMTIGPGLQACLTPLQCSKPSMESHISLDMFTTAGLV